MLGSIYMYMFFVHHLWIICVIYVLCLSCFRVCSLLPCGHLLGKSWPLGSCVWCLIVILSLTHVASWVRCGTWLYWFLIFAVFITLLMTNEVCWDIFQIIWSGNCPKSEEQIDVFNCRNVIVSLNMREGLFFFAFDWNIKVSVTFRYTDEGRNIIQYFCFP